MNQRWNLPEVKFSSIHCIPPLWLKLWMKLLSRWNFIHPLHAPLLLKLWMKLLSRWNFIHDLVIMGHAVVDGVLVGAGLLWPLEPAFLLFGWDGMGSHPVAFIIYRVIWSDEWMDWNWSWTENENLILFRAMG